MIYRTQSSDVVFYREFTSQSPSRDSMSSFCSSVASVSNTFLGQPVQSLQVGDNCIVIRQMDKYCAVLYGKLTIAVLNSMMDTFTAALNFLFGDSTAWDVDFFTVDGLGDVLYSALVDDDDTTADYVKGFTPMILTPFEMKVAAKVVQDATSEQVTGALLLAGFRVAASNVLPTATNFISSFLRARPMKAVTTIMMPLYLGEKEGWQLAIFSKVGHFTLVVLGRIQIHLSSLYALVESYCERLGESLATLPVESRLCNPQEVAGRCIIHFVWLSSRTGRRIVSSEDAPAVSALLQKGVESVLPMLKATNASEAVVIRDNGLIHVMQKADSGTCVVLYSHGVIPSEASMFTNKLMRGFSAEEKHAA